MEEPKKRNKGIGTNHDSPPMCVKLPPEYDAYIRSKPDRSDWMRRVIIEAVDREKGGG